MSATGFYPASQEAARVLTDASGNQSVQNGPFEGPSLGGYSIINVQDITEATDLVKSFPYKVTGRGIEIRRIVDLNDLPIPDAAKAKAKEIR